MPVLFLFSVSRGQTFRRYSGSPLEARFTPSEGVVIGRLRRPGVSVPTDRGKRGQDTIWFPCPLLTPPTPPLRRDSLWSRSETGETWARFRASGRFRDAVMP